MDHADEIRKQLTKMRAVYLGLTAPMILFGVAVYYLITSGAIGPPDYSLAIPLQTVALILVPSGMAAGYFLFRYALPRIRSKPGLLHKLTSYLTLVLIRSVCFEIPFFFCCVAAYMTGEIIFLWVAPLILFVFLLSRPTAEGIASDLELDASERTQMGLV